MQRLLAPATAFVFFAALVVPNATAAEDESSEKAGEESSQGSAEAPESSDDEGGEMSEEERQAWKQRKRRAAQIAVRDAAGPEGWLERSWTWDLNFDVGLRALGSRSGDWTVQARTGITRISEPGAYSAGVTGQIAADGRPILGMEAEVLSLNLGTFARLGGGVGFDGEARWSAGVGWHVFSLEAAFEPGASSRDRWTGLAELRLPVSWIVRGVSDGGDTD